MVTYVEIYTALLSAARSIIDMGSQYQETLNEYTLELDGALRQMHLTVIYQLKTAIEPQMAQALRQLEDEILLTMKSLRRDGVDAMLPKMDVAVDADPVADGERAITSLDEDHSIGLLTQHATLPTVIVKSLSNPREGTRYAALAIIHDHISAWFRAEEVQDVHHRFKEAQLVFGLSTCLADGENFELLSGILAQLLSITMWRDEIVGCFLLSRYHAKALDLLKSQQPSFRRLEVYLNVWRSASRFLDCATFTSECESDEAIVVVLNCMIRLGGTEHPFIGQPQPYIPDAMAQYVGTIHTRRGENDVYVKRLRSAFQSLIVLTSNTWWNLAET